LKDNLKIALRIDDIGASTKKFEIYSKKRFGNILFFKYLKYFRAWAPYSELTAKNWESIFEILKTNNANLTVGVTATWVESDGTLVPFPEKYPDQANLLKFASESGLIEIANHGLTHCVVGQHLPRMFTSNRKYHREFWEWIPRDMHFKHLEKSQKIFHEWLGKSPTTLIPPGNVYSVDTLNAAEKYGFKIINSYINLGVDSEINVLNSTNIDAFHDKDIDLHGVKWLEDKIKSYPKNTDFCLINEFHR
jgi:peptidoglycan/xylan/chitin deacetylase (PgdA/CDA1 family)